MLYNILPLGSSRFECAEQKSRGEEEKRENIYFYVRQNHKKKLVDTGAGAGGQMN